MKNPLRLFSVRVTLAIIASMVTLVVLGDIALFQFTTKSQFEGLRFYLKNIAKTSAITINSQYLTEIPLTKEGVRTQAYDIISEQLKKIKAANPQIKYIYILTKTDGGKVWKFVVDADESEGSGGMHRGLQLGAIYDASRFTQMINSLDVPSADLKLEKDEWGTTLSGYA
ncbi:MAG: hypothetical protein WCH62_01695, partial [Candidatus Omnitrophota bacterium]